MIFCGRLNGKQRNRLKSLLDMLYTPKELADEVGILVNQVYSVYVPFGCPSVRDVRRHIFINGKLFADWYSKVYLKIRLRDDETFCKTCKGAVKIFQPEQKEKDGLIYVVSVCPVCGRGLTKIIQFKR